MIDEDNSEGKNSWRDAHEHGIEAASCREFTCGIPTRRPLRGFSEPLSESQRDKRVPMASEERFLTSGVADVGSCIS